MPLPRRIENIPQEYNKDSSHQTEKNNVRSGESLARKSNSIPTKRPVRDDTFMEDEPLPPIAEVSPHGVKNLDEKELDELLGINDVINVDEEENDNSLSTPVDDALPDFDNNEMILPSSEKTIIKSDTNIKDTENNDTDDDFEIDSLLKSLNIDENDESSENEILPETELELSENDSVIDDNDFEGLFDEIDNDDNTQNAENVSLDTDDDEIIIDFEDDSEDDTIINNKNSDDSEDDFYFENETDSDDSEDGDDFEIDSLLKSLDADDDESNSDNEIEQDEDWGFSENENDSDDDGNDAFTSVEVEDKENDESEIVNDYFDDEEVEEIDEESKPFNFYDDDEDNVNEEKKTSQDKESMPKTSKNKKSGKGFKNKFENIKNQVLADLKGEDSPIQNSFDEQHDEDEKYNDENTESNKSKSSLPGSKALDLIKKPYLFIANIFFSILKGIFGFLAQIPLIGIVFKPLLSATKILEKISLFMPLIFVIGVFVTISYFQVPRESMIELPDNGGGTFSEFKYDYKTNSAIGKVTNTGEIILESKPEFTVHAIVPGLNPKTWFIPVEVGKCEGKIEKVDIDSSKEVTAECEKTNGYIKRTSGVLK